MTSKKTRPEVTIREKTANTVRVEFMFPDGKGGLIEFSFGGPDGDRIELYRCDPGITITNPVGFDYENRITR